MVNCNLGSERLRLREIAWNDVETIHALHSIPEVDEFNTLRVVLEKIGMTREGAGRKILPIRGAWKDNYRYAILEDDPRDY